MKLLQNQVLNYNNNNNNILIASPRIKKKATDSHHERQKLSMIERLDAPPSPIPDYFQKNNFQPRVQSLGARKQVSKSISSLVVDNDFEVKLSKKLSESSLELRTSPTIPIPDYEGIFFTLVEYFSWKTTSL